MGRVIQLPFITLSPTRARHVKGADGPMAGSLLDHREVGDQLGKQVTWGLNIVADGWAGAQGHTTPNPQPNTKAYTKY